VCPMHVRRRRWGSIQKADNASGEWDKTNSRTQKEHQQGTLVRWYSFLAIPYRRRNMEGLIILFIVIVILGALAGGKSFGETVSKGCGCVSLIVVVIIGVIIFAAVQAQHK